MKNLLVPIDFSDVTERVVEAADEIARAFDAKLWLMHCASDYPIYAAMGEASLVLPIPDGEPSERFPEQYRQLSDVVMSERNKGVDAEMLFVVGSPIEEILSAADDRQVDLIVIGSHGHGAFYELVVGSTTSSVLHRTNRRSLVVPTEMRKAKIVVPGEKTTAQPQWEEPLATPY